jgi:hypothetical protein
VSAENLILPKQKTHTQTHPYISGMKEKVLRVQGGKMLSQKTTHPKEAAQGRPDAK